MVRASFVILCLLSIGGQSWAGSSSCPTSCVAGGGSPKTDCLVQFGGISSTTVNCTDGDPGCDADGVVNGVCKLPLSVCVNLAADGCTTGLSSAPTLKPVKDDASTALSQALAALSLTETQCTTGGYELPVKASLKGLKPGKAKLAIGAKGSAGKDTDKLKLACLPSASAPSLATEVQPIFTAKCATAECHEGLAASGNLNLETGNSYAETVNVTPDAGSFAKGQLVVTPGSLTKSYMARKILGQGLNKFDAPMPQGCPGTAECLTQTELLTILAWIQAGAPNN